jgi:Prolyl oligopeptidase family
MAVNEVLGHARDWIVGHREQDLPAVRPTPAVAMKWLVDEWAHQTEVVRGRIRWPNLDFRRRMRDELGDAEEMFDDRGWIADPRSYHRDPPPVTEAQITPRRIGFTAFQQLSAPSRFEPHRGEPGGERWTAYVPNRTAHAWLLEHDGPPRPWLVCINGYRSGQPLVDFGAFDARRLHVDLGLNLAFPVQPLHGPRSEGASGDRVLHGGAMNTVHTAAQGVWDLRRLVSWIRRERDAPAVGAMGISLGGYLASLLTCFDDDLACVIAGVPEPDLVRGMRRNHEPLLPPFYEMWGLSWRSLERVNRVVSPLAMEPLVDRERLFIFAGLVDRWVRPGNVRSLWEHWGRPEICWYEGSHLSFPFERDVRAFVGSALDSTLLTELQAEEGR